jgi:sugar phosphate isomerase/epimerase
MHVDVAPRWGINSQTTPSADVEEFLRSAGENGLTLVELAAEIIDRPASEIRAMSEAASTSILGVCPSREVFDWHLGWSDELARRLESELRRAAELGARYFVMPFMREGGTAESVRAALELAVPRARAVGLGLAVEPIGHVDVLRTARELAPVLETQDPETVGLLLDSFHFFRAGQHVDDLAAYDGIPIWGLQISNINDVPLEQALGYRDRRFPLDGRMPVTELCARVLADRPEVPLIVEVIGDVARATPTPEGMRRARRQLDDIRSAIPDRKA